MNEEKYIPSEALAKKAAELTYMPPINAFWKAVVKIFTGKDIKISESPNRREIKMIQDRLSELLYGAVQVMCYRNLACEYFDEDLKKQIAQIPDNPKISIVSDSREKFNLGIEKIIEEFIPIKGPKDFLSDLNREFFDYVSKTNRYTTRLGEFYLDSGKVYFKTEKSLPKEKLPAGDSVVVGGIGFD